MKTTNDRTEVREMITKHLHKNYICGWNNSILDKDNDEEIKLNDLYDLMLNTFSADNKDTEIAIMIYLIEKTKDTKSVIEFWQKNWSPSEGRNTLSSGSYSHSEGQISLSSGGYSHSEGFRTTGSGSHSHAEGVSTIGRGITNSVITGSTASYIPGHATGTNVSPDGYGYGTTDAGHYTSTRNVY